MTLQTDLSTRRPVTRSRHNLVTLALLAGPALGALAGLCVTIVAGVGSVGYPSAVPYAVAVLIGAVVGLVVSLVSTGAALAFGWVAGRLGLRPDVGIVTGSVLVTIGLFFWPFAALGLGLISLPFRLLGSLALVLEWNRGTFVGRRAAKRPE